MKKIVMLFTVVAMLCLCVGCTEQTRARSLGGTTHINLPAGQKLIEVTWKESNLWYLTAPMEDDYIPTVKTFQEDSEWGMIEGTVIFHESR